MSVDKYLRDLKKLNSYLLCLSNMIGKYSSTGTSFSKGFAAKSFLAL
jgi:hypothetical protein